MKRGQNIIDAHTSDQGLKDLAQLLVGEVRATESLLGHRVGRTREDVRLAVLDTTHELLFAPADHRQQDFQLAGL